MKKNKIFGWILSGAIGLSVVLTAFSLIQCGGGDGSSGDSSSITPSGNTTTYDLSLGGAADNITLTAGETTEIKFIGNTPGPQRTYDAITLNLQRILDAGYVETAAKSQNRFLELLSKISFINKAAAAYQWRVSLRVGEYSGPSDLDTICEEGWLYGPYIMAGEDKPETSDTASVAADAGTVDLINYGEFAICILVESPVDMTLSIKDYSVDVTTCDEDPADFEGVWTGTYFCENEGTGDCSDEDGDIELTITQDGHRAKYTDGYANYSGTVCGDKFAFSGGVEGDYGYIEKGQLTLNSDGSASKVSSFVNTEGSCSGDCADELVRQ